MLNILDRDLFLYLNQNLHNGFFDKFFPFITNLGHFELILLILGIWILIKGTAHQRLSLVLLIFSITLAESLNNTMKELIGRIRPCWALEGVRLLVGKANSYSFPSGHATNVFAAATVITYEFRKNKWITIPIIIIACLVSYSRIYVGVHYPFDVLGGILLGIITSICVLVFNKYYPLIIKAVGTSEKRISYFSLFIQIAVVLTAFRLSYIAAFKHTLTPEEAQYWDWSRHLDWSYYSKPPLIAYLIRVFTELFGHSAFSVRLSAITLSIFLGIITWLFVKEIFQSDKIAFFSILLLNLMPLFSAGAIIITTDTPMALFWAWTLWMVYRAIFKNQPHAWYLSGILLGFGLLSKYTMILLIPCIILYLIFSKEHRFWLTSSEPYIACLIGFIMCLPILFWNYSNDWVTFKHVAGQANVTQGFMLKPKEFFDFLGSQAGVITPFFFLGMVFSSFSMIRKEGMNMNNKMKFLLCTSVPVFLFFLLKSAQGKVEANWAAPAYYSWTIFLVAVYAKGYVKRKMEGTSKSLGFLITISCLTGFLLTLAMHDMNLVRSLGIDLPPRKDPTGRLVGWEQLGNLSSHIQNQMPRPAQTFFFSEQYQITAELGFYVHGQPQAYCVNLGRRMNQYDLWKGPDDKKGWDAIYVTYDDDKPLDQRITSSFERIDSPDIIQVKKKDLVYNQFRIYRCYGFQGQLAGGIKPTHF